MSRASAPIRGERELPIGKSARAAPAGNDIPAARLRRGRAVLVQRRAAPDIQPLLDDQDGSARIRQFQRGEDPRRPGADDNDIIAFCQYASSLSRK